MKLIVTFPLGGRDVKLVKLVLKKDIRINMLHDQRNTVLIKKGTVVEFVGMAGIHADGQDLACEIEVFVRASHTVTGYAFVPLDSVQWVPISAEAAKNLA